MIFFKEPFVDCLALYNNVGTGIGWIVPGHLVKATQRLVVEEDYLVPLYLNPFVHAVGPSILPEGEAIHRYWGSLPMAVGTLRGEGVSHGDIPPETCLL
jgi:hypothetical protein